jgi:hypothetical protein
MADGPSCPRPSISTCHPAVWSSKGAQLSACFGPPLNRKPGFSRKECKQWQRT